MKKFIILFSVTFLSLFAHGQCYQPSRSEAIKEFNAKEFLKAKGIFQAMKSCPDKPEKNDVDFWITKCNQALNPQTRQQAVSFADRMAAYEEHSILGFNEGMMAVQKKADLEKLDKMPEGCDIEDYAPKVGFVNEEGILTVPCRYEDPDFYSMKMGYFFSDGLAAVIKRYASAPFVKISSNNNRIPFGWGYIDKKGNEVIPFIYSDAQAFSEGLAAVQTQYGEYWKFIDKSGKNAMNRTFYWAGSFSEGLCLVLPDSTSQGYGYINKKGELVIPAKYSDASNFKNGTAAVFTKEHGYESALIDKQGQMVGDFTFRPEYLNYTDINIYAVDMFNQKQYDKCLMAIKAYEKKRKDKGDDDIHHGIMPYMEGWIYYNGYGSHEKDYQKAFQAFSNGDESNSIYMQATCYYYGNGVEQNYPKAFELYKAAIERDNWDKHGFISYPSGVSKGDLKSHFTKGTALFCIGLFYYNGHIGPKDYTQALTYFKAAQQEGYSEAKKYIEYIESL